MRGGNNFLGGDRTVSAAVLLCANCNYQLLCANCHYIKALEEKEYRRGPRCVKETPSHNHVEAV